MGATSCGGGSNQKPLIGARASALPKNKKNGQDLIMTQDIIYLFKHFDVSTKAKLRTMI